MKRANIKNVFLIGNGFDLHHMLPTKYYDFMCVVNYLHTNMLTYPLTVGNIFSKVAKESENIRNCYNTYKDSYDQIEVPSEKITEISNMLFENLWFKYFSKTLDIDLGWIDLKKEISTVLTCLEGLVKEDKDTVQLSKSILLVTFVLSNFRFFIEADDDYELYKGDTLEIRKEYLYEYPHNSKIYVANKTQIFEHLHNQLSIFNKALNIYFEYFVESTFDFIRKNDFITCHGIKMLDMADNVVSFNYTSTIESLYYDKKYNHIHGTIKDSNIVLGVNPNEFDDIGANNVSLIKFKKYYQREVLETNVEYIKWYNEVIVKGTEYRLITIGHSLDITDIDVISDLFSNAKEIYVIYHDEECRINYISNIVKMFGKKGFDSFKKEKSMRFILLSSIDDLEEKLKVQQSDWMF